MAIMAQTQSRLLKVKCYKCISSTYDDTQKFNVIKILRFWKMVHSSANTPLSWADAAPTQAKAAPDRANAAPRESKK